MLEELAELQAVLAIEDEIMSGDFFPQQILVRYPLPCKVLYDLIYASTL